jgi:hypothetical protein
LLTTFDMELQVLASGENLATFLTVKLFLYQDPLLSVVPSFSTPVKQICFRNTRFQNFSREETRTSIDIVRLTEVVNSYVYLCLLMSNYV